MSHFTLAVVFSKEGYANDVSYFSYRIKGPTFVSSLGSRIGKENLDEVWFNNWNYGRNGHTHTDGYEDVLFSYVISSFRNFVAFWAYSFIWAVFNSYGNYSNTVFARRILCSSAYNFYSVNVTSVGHVGHFFTPYIRDLKFFFQNVDDFRGLTTC